ncbi:MAG TPA: RidA family protein [Nocardioidaceae bacterium]|nr:RidA family protein [Nocardioidaceae bacterium]
MTGELEFIARDPRDAPEAAGGYAQGLSVRGASELLFISGQIPEDRQGIVPATFEEQCRMVWRHIDATLDAAGLTLRNLVKVTTYLSSREFAATNSAIRQELLGDHRVALTVVVAKIFDPVWLLEIEAIAAA